MFDLEKLEVGDSYKIGRREYVCDSVMLSATGGEATFHSYALMHRRLLRVVGGKWEMCTGKGQVISKGEIK